MSEPLSGVELRLAVARVLGLKPPEGPGWEKQPDGTWHLRTRSVLIGTWPDPYDTDPKRALEAWKQATTGQGSDVRLDLTVWPDGDVFASMIGDRINSAWLGNYDVATAICRALVAWWRRPK